MKIRLTYNVIYQLGYQIQIRVKFLIKPRNDRNAWNKYTYTHPYTITYTHTDKQSHTIAKTFMKNTLYIV